MDSSKTFSLTRTHWNSIKTSPSISWNLGLALESSAISCSSTWKNPRTYASFRLKISGKILNIFSPFFPHLYRPIRTIKPRIECEHLSHCESWVQTHADTLYVLGLSWQISLRLIFSFGATIRRSPNTSRADSWMPAFSTLWRTVRYGFGRLGFR